MKRAARLRAPEGIEVEPVVGCEAAVVLEARGVALDPRLQPRVALGAAGVELVGEWLEVDRVAPAAEVQPEEQHHRRLENRREQQRSLRKARRAAEEVALHGAVGLEGAVAEQADDLVALQALAHAQQRLRAAERDHARAELGTELARHDLDVGGVVRVEQHVHRQPAVQAAHHAQHLEAAEVRAEQQAAAPLRERGLDDLLAVLLDGEFGAAPGEEVHAVVQRPGEGHVMARDVAQPRRPIQHATEIIARRVARAPREGEEVAADRVEQQAAGGVPQAEQQPHRGLHREQGAALALLEPYRAHAKAKLPEAISVSPRCTLNFCWSMRMENSSPGRSGAWNFTVGRRATPRPARRRTSSSKTTPGTIGLPGKCPARAGWSCGIITASSPSPATRPARAAPRA